MNEEVVADALRTIDLDDLATAIMPAIPTNTMGKSFLPAVGAGDQRGGGKGIMSPATVAASRRYLTLW